MSAEVTFSARQDKRHRSLGLKIKNHQSNNKMKKITIIAAMAAMQAYCSYHAGQQKNRLLLITTRL
jgi:hypothetical protein